MTSLPTRLAQALAFDVERAENRTAYHRLDNPKMSASQAYFEGERHAVTRLAPLHERLIACAERLETIQRRGDIGAANLRLINEAITALAEELEKMEGEE